MIPKIIHQVWVGQQEPEFIAKAMQSVKDKNPEYEYILHGNEAIKKYHLEHLYGEVPHAFIADMIRIRVLQESGGWYLDADMTAKHGLEKLPDSIHEAEFCTLQTDFGKGLVLANGMIGVSEEYDLIGLIEQYDGTYPLVDVWYHYFNGCVIIPNYLCGLNGIITTDLAMNSWGENPYNIKAGKHCSVFRKRVEHLVSGINTLWKRIRGVKSEGGRSGYKY